MSTHLKISGCNYETEVNMKEMARFSIRMHLFISAIVLSVLIPVGMTSDAMEDSFRWRRGDRNVTAFEYEALAIHQTGIEAVFMIASAVSYVRFRGFVQFLGMSHLIRGIASLVMSTYKGNSAHNDITSDGITFTIIGALTLVLYINDELS